MPEDNSTAQHIHITVFNRVLVTQFDVITMLLSYHNNVTPFMSRQYHSFYVMTMLLLFTSRHYYSLVGRFFFLGAPACNSPLDESASDYSSSLVLLEVSPANYSFRKPIVGQNRLLLFWSPAASLVCQLIKSVDVACCMSLDC